MGCIYKDTKSKYEICVCIYAYIFIDLFRFMFTFITFSIYYKIQLHSKHSDLIDKGPFFRLIQQTAKANIVKHRFSAPSLVRTLFYTVYLLHQTSE